MTIHVSRLILATSAVAVVTIAAAYFLFPIRPEIGGLPGLVYWTLVTLVASALPVRLPRGVVVSVAGAPMIAVAILGGPLAAAVVAAIGTTDSREVRGEVPWFGTLFNHASALIALVIGAMAFEVLITLFGESPAALTPFLAAVVASTLFFALNWLFAVVAVSVRTSAPLRAVWSQDIAAIALSFAGLAPLAWLMAQVFQIQGGVGWWATLLFVVPLFTTRLSYSRYVETRELFEQTIRALSNAVDARDKYTRNHSSRVSRITEAMCRVMKLPEADIEKIKWAALLHDVGKIGIRDNILLKEGPLDREERILMNQHPTIGAEIVAPARQLHEEAPLIKAHHEWFNGSGYPDGLEALNIPLGARIMTIADAYEAMTSSRPYRKTPLSHEIAVAELEKYAGIQFDPDIVPILVGLDRSILDREPDRPDELPTMLHAPDPRERVHEPAPGKPQTDPRAAMTEEPKRPARPALASDDVS